MKLTSSFLSLNPFWCGLICILINLQLYFENSGEEYGEEENFDDDDEDEGNINHEFRFHIPTYYTWWLKNSIEYNNSDFKSHIFIQFTEEADDDK